MSSTRLVVELDRRYTSSTSCTRYPCTLSSQIPSAHHRHCLQNTSLDGVPDVQDSAKPPDAPRHSSDDVTVVVEVVRRHLNHLNTLHRRRRSPRLHSLRRSGDDDDVF